MKIKNDFIKYCNLTTLKGGPYGKQCFSYLYNECILPDRVYGCDANKEYINYGVKEILKTYNNYKNMLNDITHFLMFDDGDHVIKILVEYLSKYISNDNAKKLVLSEYMKLKTSLNKEILDYLKVKKNYQKLQPQDLLEITI